MSGQRGNGEDGLNSDIPDSCRDKNLIEALCRELLRNLGDDWFIQSGSRIVGPGMR